MSCAIFLLTGSSAIAQQTEEVSPAGTKYLLYIPPNYNPALASPMLIVLHGQGGMGENLSLLLNKDEIPPKLINQNRWPSHYPFIVVSPQMKRDLSVEDPAEQKWPPELIDEVAEHVRSGYAVNPNKIYVTGLSQGGHGTYDYARAYSSKVAAAVYVSGAPDSTVACEVRNVPLWVFHGTDDSLVPPLLATGLMRNLDDCSPPGKFKARLTMMHGRRHEGWNEVYNNSSGFNIYDWMLKFTKNSPSNTPPYVNAGKDVTIAQRTESIHLFADAFDSDGSIARISWTKIGATQATMADVNSPFLKLTNVSTGVHEFEVTAMDEDGAQARDRVRLTIVPQNSISPAITGLVLLNANNNQSTIASLYDGYVVNPKTQTRYVNIRPEITGNVQSVRYSINGNHDSRTINRSPSTSFSLASPRWTLDGGEYLVCATPYASANATGAAGVSQCFRIVVSTTATAPPPPEEEPPAEEPPVEEPPVEEPPVEEPPVEEPPVEEPPVEEPPVEEPPVEEPPVEEPPVEEPPVEEPPVEEPPVEEPPVEEPPVEEPPVEEPPVEEPPVEEPPVEEPPVEEPPVEEPPVEEPPVEEPPVEEPPVEEPPVEEPPVEEPPVEEPPVEEPPVEEPPVEEPPAEEPPVEEPPVEEPPVESPPVNGDPVTEEPRVRPPSEVPLIDPVTDIFETPQREVSLYPNPASEAVHVQFQAPVTETLYYLITNSLGERIAYGEWQTYVLSSGQQIDVRTYASGVYILTLRGPGWNYQKKFIVGSR